MFIYFLAHPLGVRGTVDERREKRTHRIARYYCRSTIIIK